MRADPADIPSAVMVHDSDEGADKVRGEPRATTTVRDGSGTVVDADLTRRASPSARRGDARLVPIADGPRYRLGEVLGEGGMGEVLLAHDEHIGRDVAIKRIRSTEPSAEGLSRFLREAAVPGR